MGKRKKAAEELPLLEAEDEAEAEAEAEAAAAAAARPASSQPALKMTLDQLANNYCEVVSTLEQTGAGPKFISRISPGCYAMRGFITENGEWKGIKASDFNPNIKKVADYDALPVHIYTVPLHFSDCNYVHVACDCGDPDVLSGASLQLYNVNGDGTPKFRWIDENDTRCPLAPSNLCVHAQAFRKLRLMHPEDAAPEDFFKSLGATDDAGDLLLRYDDEVRIVCADTQNLLASVALEDEFGIFSRSYVTAIGAKIKNVDGLVENVRHIRCLRRNCRHGDVAFKCQHAVRFRDYIESLGEGDAYDIVSDVILKDDNVEIVRTRKVDTSRQCISTKLIDVDYVALLERDRIEGRSSAWLPPENENKCIPTCEGNCPLDGCGAPWNAGDPIENNWKRPGTSMLYGPYSAKEVDVYYRPCSNTNCTARKQYDGHEDGVFNYSGQTLFLHSTLRDYILSMTHIKTTCFGYHAIVKERYKLTGQTLCSVGVMNRALATFIGLIDVGPFKEMFKCYICSRLSPSEQAFIFDGLMQGFMQDSVVSDPPAGPSATDDIIKCVAPIEYAYIRESAVRTIVSGYAKGTKLPPSFKTNVRISEELRDALIYISEDGAREECPARYQRFLIEISTEYPASTFINAALVFANHGETSVMDKICAGDTFTGEIASQINTHWPVLGGLIVFDTKDVWSNLPVPLRNLFKEMAKMARKPGLQNNVHSFTLPADPLDEDAMIYMPNHPRIRQCRKYSVDVNKSSKEFVDEHGECTKHLHSSRVHTPGLFTCFCVHGICHGYQAMRRYEGPSTLFKMVYERFEHAPGMLIYDNACNAARYALSREPGHFASSGFRIDRLHFKNHKGCHMGFCLDAYPQTTKILGGAMTLKQLNSQCVEQANSRLKHMGGITFMNEKTYMHYVKLYLFLLNRNKKRKNKTL